jgi:hypothetical protein
MHRLCRSVPVVASCLTIAAAAAAAQTTGKDGSDLEKCDKPIGTLAVHEPQNDVIASLRRYQLESPTSLIRMMVQQSNCFTVVERGVAMQNIMQERQLAQGGELQQGSNMGKGQMVTADYVLTPNVLIAEPNAGGVGGGIGGFGRKLGVVGAIAGGLKFKEAQTSILIADTRTTVQVAAAEGKAKKTDFRLGMLGWGGGAVGAVGGYTNTNEGKVIAASFLDNYNQIVRSVRSNPEMQKAAASGGAAASGPKAGAVYNEGDVLAPKIDNVKLLADAADGARAVATLKKGDDVVFLGEEKNGFLKVQGGSAEGWVKKSLVGKK